MGKRYRDRDWLEVMYHGRELTQREIAETCGVSPTTIRNWMNEHGIPTRDVEGRHHGMHGRERSDEEKEQIAESLRGREYDDEWRERLAEAKSGEEIPEAVREKISESLEGTTKSDETRRKMSESSRGDENANWQGGHVQNYGIGWRPARRAVHARDVVCRQCGHDGSEDRLEVHHLLPVRAFRDAESTDVEDAHDLSNLVLLCKPCHIEAEYDGLAFESGLTDPRELDEDGHL